MSSNGCNWNDGYISVFGIFKMVPLLLVWVSYWTTSRVAKLDAVTLILRLRLQLVETLSKEETISL